MNFRQHPDLSLKISSRLSRGGVVLILTAFLASLFAGTLHANTYATWKTQVFTSADQANPAVSGETANPSGDGIDNLEKYAFGLNPYQNVSTGTPTSSTVQQGGQLYLGLTCQIPSANAPTDLLYTPQVSPDLANWSQGSPAVSLYSTQGPANGLNFYTYIAGNLPIGANPKVFMRLQVAETAVISLASGSYASAQTVTITGPPNATLYYTTDGSTPTNNSFLYTGPLTIAYSLNLQVQAYVNGVPYGGVAVANYSINSPAITNSVGATTPFTTYEAETGTLAGGAAVVALTVTPTTEFTSPQLEASGHAYVALTGTGQSITWTNNTSGSFTGINVRFSIPDSTTGGGHYRHA